MTISNNADAFKIHFNMLHMSGIWPEEAPGIFYNIRGALTWIFGTGLSISMLMEVIHDVTDLTKLAEALYVMVSVVVYLVKLGGFTYQKKTFVNMVNFLKDPIFMSYPDDLDHYMAKTIKISTFLANLYRYLGGCLMVTFSVYPVLDNKPMPFPFPYDLGRYRYVMYVFQVVSVSVSAWNNNTLDTLTTSLMGIAAAQLDILKEKIVAIGKDNDNERKGNQHIKEKLTIRKLKQCVDHHLAIIRFIESIERVFTVGLLAQFVGSALVICNTLFLFVLTSATSMQFFMLANYLIIAIVELFIYCWYGNEIMLKSIRVGEACYLSNWYNCSSEVCKYLFIIMERSKRPLAVAAWKFSKLSLAALTSVLQWSYSYLTLLLNMYNKQSLPQ